MHLQNLFSFIAMTVSGCGRDKLYNITQPYNISLTKRFGVLNISNSYIMYYYFDSFNLFSFACFFFIVVMSSAVMLIVLKH